MQQKKQLILLAVLVIGLLFYLGYSFIFGKGSAAPSKLPPREDPSSPQFIKQGGRGNDVNENL